MASQIGKTVKRKSDIASPSGSKKSKSVSVASPQKGKAKANLENDDIVMKEAATNGKKSNKAVLRAPRSEEAFEIGPVLISTTDFEPPRDVQYTLHHQVASGSSGIRGASLKDRLILSGETDTIDYVAWNQDIRANTVEEQKDKRECRGYTGEYMVGIYDPEIGTVTLRAAPVFTLNRSVKSLTNQSLDISTGTKDWKERIAARRGLGETFGNRKTRLKARNEDRMKVDTSNMLDVMSTMQDGIEEVMQDVPTEADMQEEADQNRPIPPPNMNALTPQEAYPLEVLIPNDIFPLINVKYLQQQVDSPDQLGRNLPVAGPGRSSWLKDRFWSHIQVSQLSHNKLVQKFEFDEGHSNGSPSSNGILKSSIGANKSEAKVKLKILWYVSVLWGFVKVVGGSRDKGGEKEALLKKLKLDQMHGGETILDDLFNRFAQAQRGSSRYVAHLVNRFAG